MTPKHGLITQNKVFCLIAAATGVVLLVPLIAMQFSDEVNWTLSDFVAMGVLIMGMTSAFVLVARRLDSGRKRLVAAVIFGVLLLWLWAELAVGVFTNWGS